MQIILFMFSAFHFIVLPIWDSNQFSLFLYPRPKKVRAIGSLGTYWVVWIHSGLEKYEITKGIYFMFETKSVQIGLKHTVLHYTLYTYTGHCTLYTVHLHFTSCGAWESRLDIWINQKRKKSF